jgi:hypothetical protein
MSRIIRLQLPKTIDKPTLVQTGRLDTKNEGQGQTGSSTDEISQMICGCFKGRQFRESSWNLPKRA